MNDTTCGNEVRNQVGNVCPCLERGARGGNKDFGVNSLEEVGDPLIVNKVSEGKYTKKRAEG